MRRRLYTVLLLVALTAGVASVLLHGLAPFSWVSYFTEMYPFFFGVSIMAGLFLLVLRSPVMSLAGFAVYWIAVGGAIVGCLVLCVLGLFANPINWKNYVEYTSFDRVWSPLSNSLVVVVSIMFAVLMVRELRSIRRSHLDIPPRSEPEHKN